MRCCVHPGKIFLPAVRSRRSVLNAACCRHLLGEHFETARTCSVAPEPLVAEESVAAEAGTETATDAAGEAEDDVHWVFDEQEEMLDEEVVQEELEVEVAT